MSSPSAVSAMLPRKAEKRMASSVFITLASPRREAAPREQPRTGVSLAAPEGSPHPPMTPALPNGESCPRSPAVPSSPPALVLSEAPQPLSAEALAPALQQLDLAAPATVQAPFALPAELRPLQVCQGQADKLQWQDANGHVERDSSRGKHMALAVVVPQWGHQGSSLPCSLPTDICAFCHKAVGPQEPTVEAMRKQYHADCFTCRTCQRRLAGQRYYQRDGRPTCDACYQATLEKCAKCQGLITERIVRALGKGFHPGCFVCAACGRAIGAESFAVDEQGKVYCVADFYRWGSTSRGVQLIPVTPWVSHHHLHFIPPRKFAPVCGACKRPIIPDEDTYKIECLGRSFHESCYRCEVWPQNSKCCPSASQSIYGVGGRHKAWVVGEVSSTVYCRQHGVGLQESHTHGCTVCRAVGRRCHRSRQRMGATLWATTCSAKPAICAGGTSRPAELQAVRRAVPLGWTHREQRDQRVITRVCQNPKPCSSASAGCSSQAEKEQWW
ncbi:filamin-binding LIM protein 1 isoform X3 [Phasianus colchicus]|uniref:filamin-binding LIM protein 1 isoform X3 n=1 Tax=Phasianus colchicus TaxID=9054 RepID=UPI00129D6778|nr:filamin-binding LIM protein 1 isoform X3 [Phasianus colchicus]